MLSPLQAHSSWQNYYYLEAFIMSKLGRKQIVLWHVWFILMSFMSLGYQF
jgi:hypothetical protein